MVYIIIQRYLHVIKIHYLFNYHFGVYFISINFGKFAQHLIDIGMKWLISVGFIFENVVNVSLKFAIISP